LEQQNGRQQQRQQVDIPKIKLQAQVPFPAVDETVVSPV